MDLDLNTSDVDLHELGSSENGSTNSSSEEGSDGETWSSASECDVSDTEDFIKFSEGIREINSFEGRAVVNLNRSEGRVDENLNRNEGRVEENLNRSDGRVEENNYGGEIGEEINPSQNSGGKDLANSLTTQLQNGSSDVMADDVDPETRKMRILCEAIEKRLAVGSIVQDLEQAYLLYCEYGRLKGFGVRRGEQRYHGQSQDIKWKEYLCCCTGVPDSKCSDRRLPAYKRIVLRTGCRAKIRVHRKVGSPWHVTIFDIEHNHSLVPADQTYMLRSSRNLSYAQKSILEALHTAGIGVSQSCEFMEKESGGVENLGFVPRDAYNYFAGQGRKSKLKREDSNLLHDFFIKQSNEDNFFYWNAEKDGEGRLMNFFFRDGLSLCDYEAFSDVLSVDTTYSTNKYNLICAPFVGINHHKFTCMFGIGFLSDETAASFQWLFTEFLKSMNGRQPKIIFTDQCVAMMNAIEKVFPESKHRLCQWHVQRNATKRFGSLNKNKEFKKLWRRCMNDVEDEDEFEIVWRRLMHFTNPLSKSQSWFKAMFKLRHRWASVYTRDIFTGGLLATSRSEGANRCVKRRNRRTHSLIQFVMNYEELKMKWRRREKEEDTRGMWMPGQLVSKNQLFTQAATTYTRNVYAVFEKEAMSLWDVELSRDHVDLGDGNLQITATMVSYERDRQIVYNKNTKCARCTCGMWESEGILCRHILMVYHAMKNYEIPESQILKRWTKTAKAVNLIKNVVSDKTETLSTMLFVSKIVRRAHDISYACLDHQDCQSILIEKMEELGKVIYEMTGLTPSKIKRKCVSDDTENNENTAPFTDPKRLPKKGPKLGTKNDKKKKGTSASKKGKNVRSHMDNGNEEQVPVSVTPVNAARKPPTIPSSGSRIPFQMNDPPLANRNLYERHSAGLIPSRSTHRSLSQP